MGSENIWGFRRILGIEEGMFESVHRSIESKIDGWAEKFLSPTGKGVLIKSVTMATSNHAMACFKFPVSTCKEIEQVIA